MRIEIWTYRDGARDPATPIEAIVGYAVEATDGSIGKVDAATEEVGTSYIVVDTGPWIFGKKVVLPAHVIERIDAQARAVHVDVSRDDVKNAPSIQEAFPESEAAFDDLGDYYRNLARR